MVNVKGLDLFPTKIFKCKFIATEEMTDYIKDNQKAAMHTHVSNLVKQSKNNNLQTLTIYKMEARGERFLDYSFDVDFANENIENTFNNSDILYQFDDSSYVEIIVFFGNYNFYFIVIFIC